MPLDKDGSNLLNRFLVNHITIGAAIGFGVSLVVLSLAVVSELTGEVVDYPKHDITLSAILSLPPGIVTGSIISIVVNGVIKNFHFKRSIKVIVGIALGLVLGLILAPLIGFFVGDLIRRFDMYASLVGVLIGLFQGPIIGGITGAVLAGQSE